MAESVLLGIDGGGTRCRARLADLDGTVLSEAEAGPANTRLGLDVVFANITRAAERALKEAGMEPDLSRVRVHAGMGLAGLSLERERNMVRTYAHPFQTMLVESDAYIACLGAHAGRNGGVLVLGTGSCGCVLVDGEERTIGGWGFEVSDHASGAAIGRKVVRQSLLAFEGGIEATGLTRAVMDRFGESQENVVTWAEQARPGDFGEFSRLASEWAAKGDTVALKILRWAAEDAALLIRALAAKGAGTVVLVGGVARSLEPLLPPDAASLLAPSLGDPLCGALLLARRGLE